MSGAVVTFRPRGAGEDAALRDSLRRAHRLGRVVLRLLAPATIDGRAFAAGAVIDADADRARELVAAGRARPAGGVR